MHNRPRLVIALIFAVGLVLHLAVHAVFGFSFRAPRLATLAVAVIGLRWGSITGAYLGALGGLLLALHAGGAPLIGAAAMAATGLFAGEIPSRFVIESHRAVAVATVLATFVELLVVCLLMGVVPSGGTNGLIWAAAWAVVLGPPLYRLTEWLLTPPPATRLPVEPH